MREQFFELQNDVLEFIKTKVNNKLDLFETVDDLILIPSEYYWAEKEEYPYLAYIGTIMKKKNELYFIGYNQFGKEVFTFDKHSISLFNLIIIVELINENNYE